MTSSPFTGEQQVYVHAGEFFGLQFELGTLSIAQGDEWTAFLTALNGREGTFLMGDPLKSTPRGVATGTPLVNGASQSGKTLVTDGWTATITGILKAGDWIQIGTGSVTQLYKIVQDANSNGAGQATLEIWPRLRSAPADNAAIIVTATKGLWRLKDNRRSWSEETNIFTDIVFDCVEAR
jgi:hypothetical protein